MKRANHPTELKRHSRHNPTVKFYTLGCKVNQYDTQEIRERFLRAGFSEVDNTCRADVYLINTCTVTHRADAESLNLIHRAKRENAGARIIVTGCLAELDGLKIKNAYKGCVIIKNKDKRGIVDRLSAHFCLSCRPRSGNSEAAGKTTLASSGISYLKGHTRAFLKIQDGCGNSCSYCKVRLVRGPSRSRPLEEIALEAERLVAHGAKEIVLTGICLGAYGRDLKPKKTLVELIAVLEKIAGLLRLRLSSIEAGDISGSLIRKISGSDKLCAHLHVPVQSGDDHILKRMKRGYTSAGYLSFFQKAKSAIPGLAVSTDILIGFPGEKEKNFLNTVSLLKKINPLKAHIFPYSPREGTPAAGFKDEIDPRVIRVRINILRDAAEECALVYKRSFLGRDAFVLFEERDRKNPCFWTGYSENYIKVALKSRRNLKNKLLRVRLKKIAGDAIQGVPVG